MMQPYFETHPLRGIPRGRTILRGGKTNLKPIWWTYYPGFLIQGLLGNPYPLLINGPPPPLPPPLIIKFEILGTHSFY